jgi:hypothetical protein
VKKIWQSPVLPGLVLPGAIAMPRRSHEWCDPYYSAENYPWSAIEQANMLREGCYEGGTPWGPIMCCPAPIAIGQPIYGPGMGSEPSSAIPGLLLGGVALLLGWAVILAAGANR